MNAKWFIAKYMEDLCRREPRNIGLILLVDGQYIARFVGEIDDEKLDGREARWACSLENYRAWVAHWRRLLAQNPDPFQLTSYSADDNYFIEHAGERIVGEVSDPDELFDDLYAKAVEPPREPLLPMKRLAEQVLARAGLLNRVQRDVRISVSEDVLNFDYRFDNGAPNLMKRIMLGYEDARSWDAMHAARWSFERAGRELVDGKVPRGIALVRGPTGNGAFSTDYERQIRVLSESSTVIELGSKDASERLRQELHLS